MMKWCLMLSVFLAGVALSEIYALPVPEENMLAVADVGDANADEAFRGLIPVENDNYDSRGDRGHRRKPQHKYEHHKKPNKGGGYRHSSSERSDSSDSSDDRRRPYKKPKRPPYQHVSSYSHESDSYESHHRPSYEICVKMPEYHHDE